jgi:hypothetical protein
METPRPGTALQLALLTEAVVVPAWAGLTSFSRKDCLAIGSGLVAFPC